MAEITPPFAAVGPTQTERAFPTLPRSQIARIAAHGRMRQVRPGEILFESGAMTFPFIVVIKGRVEMSRISPTGDVVIATHGPGQFSGEVNMLAGRRALARATVVEAGEVLELDRDSLLSPVQTDSELGEILMRAARPKSSLAGNQPAGSVRRRGCSKRKRQAGGLGGRGDRLRFPSSIGCFRSSAR